MTRQLSSFGPSTENASACRASVGCPHRLHYFGREDRSGKRFDANSLRRVGPPRVRDFGLRADVEVTDARNVASQIAFEVSDRRARGTVVPTGPDSFLSSEMNAQAEG